MRVKGLYRVIFFSLLLGCTAAEKPLFELLDERTTGLEFVNALRPTSKVNMLTYMYFYNGAGVATGDFNKDGKYDLFFCSNQDQNRMYLNEGEMQFRDITAEARIPNDGGWSTGVSVVDINHDGLLDLYVCRVGNYETLQQGNQLLICKGISANGIPYYADETDAYGLTFRGFSTQAAFFDQDLDGDLDMYLLNHSLRYNSTFNSRDTYFNTYDSLSGDRFFRNEAGRYVDQTRMVGINSSIIGYGLGIVVSDVNRDGYPDVYIGNDFHENDYLYLNDQKGGFAETLETATAHTSQFSMGVDAADINNDGWPELISMDMLPEDPYILKRSLGEDEYNLFNMKLRYGYNHQYARNNLQFNRGNGTFSEIGVYAGVHATDWSWSPLWTDFDNDGFKDLFVSNGIPRRLNDIDYVNFISNDDIQARIRSGEMSEKELKIVEQFPQIKLRNKFYRNSGDMRFVDVASRIANDKETFSNGAAYADLDNDGDLDIVVNNIDDHPFIYRNHAAQDSAAAITLQLSGSPMNPRAVGAQAIVYQSQSRRYADKYPVRGFQSSMETDLYIGAGRDPIDSITIIWPDLRYSVIKNLGSTKLLKVEYHSDLPIWSVKQDGQTFDPGSSAWRETSVPEWIHQENRFNEFDREPLLLKMLSTEGPAAAMGDMNNDGKPDLFLGSSKGYKSSIVLDAGGSKKIVRLPELDADSTYEDVDAVWTDIDKDGWQDLIVVSGGNEYYGETPYLTPRLYHNEGGASLVRRTDAFPQMSTTISCVRTADVNRDGYIDLFLGGRAQPFGYGKAVSSYLLINDGKGRFTDQTMILAPVLKDIGMVADAQWLDVNGDKRLDLVLAKEWDRVSVLYANENGRLTAPAAIGESGWWNVLIPVDWDGDGDMDWIAGNNGSNQRLKASTAFPVRMYCNDFDGNGVGEQVVTYYVGGKEICFAVKSDLERQMPILKKKFLYAGDFAKASLNDIFDAKKLAGAVTWTVTENRSLLYLNEGSKGIRTVALPWQFQLSSLRAGVALDVNEDGRMDVLLAGNYYENNVQLGRADADQGGILLNQSNSTGVYVPMKGAALKGQIRKIISLHDKLLLIRNNASASILQKSK
ncbi:MAG: hypothetical protein FJX83_07675 [Bacteroidetes bacterium]|nr:hypothetical protein [Bacteroidota bacterium]